MGGGRRGEKVGRTYLRRRRQIRLHLQTLSQIHQTLINLTCLSQRRALRLRISRPLTPRQINDRQRTSSPLMHHPSSSSLLHFHTEETVTATRDAVGSRACYAALVESGFEDHKRFFHGAADYLAEAGDDFAVG